MSEQNDGGGFAAASSGKSPAEIAFELVNKLKGQGVWGERNKTEILDMYAECLDAAMGLRTYEGQNRVDLPIERPGQPQAVRPVVAAAATTSQNAPQPTPQSSAATQAPSVQEQQQALKNAYAQG